MSSDQEEASRTIVVGGEGIHRAEESSFLEAEKPTL